MGLLYALCDLTFQDIKKLLKNWLFDKKTVEKLAVEILAVNELAVDKLAVDKLAVWYTSAVPLERGTKRDPAAGQTDMKVETLMYISCIRLFQSIQFLRANDVSRIRLMSKYSCILSFGIPNVRLQSIHR